MRDESLLGLKKLPQRPLPGRVMGSIAFGTLLSLRASAIFCVYGWSSAFLAHSFETDSNLGLRCSVLGLGNSLDQKCLQLIFPLRFSFFFIDFPFLAQD